MDPALIRPATMDDLDGLLTLYQEFFAESPVKMPADPNRSRPVLTEILANPARHLYVAVSSGGLIGSADLVIVANLTHHARPWAVIENVIVTAPARRQGVGTALLRRLSEIAITAGCYKIQLLSGKQRSQAHAFYRAVGFTAAAEGFKLYFDGTQHPPPHPSPPSS
jgi:GNAT superfamily N-acetyltransferase